MQFHGLKLVNFKYYFDNLGYAAPKSISSRNLRSEISISNSMLLHHAYKILLSYTGLLYGLRTRGIDSIFEYFDPRSNSSGKT